MARQSDRFYEALRSGSHTIISWVDVISVDHEVIRLPAIGGSVNVDGTAAYRRKISVDAIDVTGAITPRNNGELLTPNGTELRAYRGIRFSDAPDDYEAAALGRFRLSDSSVTDSSGGSPRIQLDGFDYSRTIARDKFKTPYIIPANTNLRVAIIEIAKMTLPLVRVNAVSTTVTTTAPMVFEAGGDPWEAISLLAGSMGCQAYFDVEGRLSVLPPHDINALPAPDFTYAPGEGKLLEVSRKFSDADMYNGVIVTGESIGDSKPPVRGEAWDENPSSPTNRFGPYGEVPIFVTDTLAKTNDECAVIARARLATLLGASAQLDITGIVNPSYEVGDIIRVKRQRAGVDGLYALDSFTIPLREGTQTLTMREQRA